MTEQVGYLRLTEPSNTEEATDQEAQSEEEEDVGDKRVDTQEGNEDRVVCGKVPADLSAPRH